MYEVTTTSTPEDISKAISTELFSSDIPSGREVSTYSDSGEESDIPDSPEETSSDLSPSEPAPNLALTPSRKALPKSWKKVCVLEFV